MQDADDKPRLFTVGHSSTPVEALLAKLDAFGIRLLVDIRRYPSSKRHPEYNRPALAFALQQVGRAYVHEVELGGMREPSPDSENGGLKNAGFRGYADHMASDAFQAALSRVRGAARRMPVALMCAEASPSHCHRLYLSDRLTADGFEVCHILAPDKMEVHRLTPEARLVDGRLVYPPEGGQASLL